MGSCLAAVAIAAAAGSCSRGEQHSTAVSEDTAVAPFVGTVVTGAPVVVAPDMSWNRDGEGWSFRGEAAVIFRIVRDLDRPLWVRVQPAVSAIGYRLRVTYEGEILAEGVVEAATEWVRRLPVHPSDPGTRRLVFEVVGAPIADGSSADPGVPVTFQRLDWGLGWKAENVTFEDVSQEIFVRRFLDLGLAGVGTTSFDGTLFLGPLAVSRRLEVADAQSFAFEAVNGSRGVATFSAECGGKTTSLEVPPLASRELRMRLPEGERRITVRVVGNRKGVFLMGRPRLAGAAGSARMPVVLVTLDTVRRDSLDLTGDGGLTPTMAGIAKTATRYENAWATAPWTLPTHASIFTGRYPSNHLAGVTRSRLSDSVPTLAGRLREAGWVTSAVVGGLFTSSRFGVLRGFATVVEPPRGMFELQADRISDRAVECIGRDGSESLFLFLNYFDAHAMYLAPEEFREKAGVNEALRDLPADSPWRAVAQGDLAAWVELTRGLQEPPPEVSEVLRRLYRAEIAFADHELGRVREALEAAGLWRPALVIVTSDHGETFGEGGWFQHSYRLVPELMEVPLVVKWPGQEEPSRDGRLVSLVDLYATILEAAGVTPDPGDGEPIQRPRPHSAERRRVLMEEHSSAIHPLLEEIRLSDRLYGAQWLDRREVFWRGGLECAEGSPGSWRTVACGGGWEDRLAALPESFREVAGRESGDGDAALDPELVEKLRALGYME